MGKWGSTVKASIMLTISQLLYGGNLVAGRILAQRINPMALAAMRGWIGILALFFIVFPHLRKSSKPKWRDMGLFALVGSMGITFAYLTYLFGLKNSTAINAAIITAALPTVTNAVLIIGWKHRPTTLEIIGLLTSFIGLIVVFTHGSLANLREFRLSYGELFLVVNVIVCALYSILGQQAMKRFSPLIVAFYSSFFGALFLTPFGIWNITSVNWHIGWSGWLLVVYMSAVITGGANLLFLNGVSLIGSGRAAIFSNMSPVFGIMLSGLILGERLEWYHCVGFLLVFSGIVFSLLKKVKVRDLARRGYIGS